MKHVLKTARKGRPRPETKPRRKFERTDWTPASDIYETESGYSIAMDLPGIDRAALDISVDDNRLIVKGNRSLEESQDTKSNRPRGKFLRTFSVPGSVNQAAIGAEYKDGVLQIRLPKRKEQKAQKVEIKIS